MLRQYRQSGLFLGKIAVQEPDTGGLLLLLRAVQKSYDPLGDSIHRSLRIFGGASLPLRE
jgi:hypothetical protein